MTERDIFIAALQREDPAERRAYLDEACAGRPDLRRQVEELLRLYAGAGSFLESPPAEPPATGPFPDVAEATSSSEVPGSRIGPYKLLQLLGEGGMGAVYVAEQEEPVKRRVALKIIKAGMDSARIIVRFEAERQALAMMDHPNIAKVLDAGTIGSEHDAQASGSLARAACSGRPYFVMELVKGIPITKFCDQEHLSPKERLDLFIPVCHAVQHAHQKGIIHRDIKPSNVLIALYDGKPVPKVIDFGVAKATAQKLTERTMFTEVGQIVGTLEYMAPEQAELNNLDIDTRADIYSLGVLLYELLTGSPPFTAKQLRSVAFTEMLRIIRESEPPKPSTKLSSSEELPSIAAKRKLEPAKLAKLVRGELDWIVMKALEKERSRRYETANALAMDVQRYLADEPVAAGPPTAGYRLRKFVRKHRGPVLAASIIAVLLVGGIIGTSLGFLRAEKQRSIAEEKETEANDERANALESATAERQAKEKEAEERRKAEKAMQQAMDALRATTDDVIQALLATKPELGPIEKEFLRTTLNRWREFAAHHADTEQGRAIRAEGTTRVAFLNQRLGQDEQAYAGLQQAVQLWSKLAEDYPQVARYRASLLQNKNDLALQLQKLLKYAEAEAHFQAALKLQEKLAADDPASPDYRQDSARLHNNLGILFIELRRNQEAEKELRQALAIKESLVADFPEVRQYRQESARTQNNLGSVFRALGRMPEAESAYRQGIKILQKLADEFPYSPSYGQELATGYDALAAVLQDRRKFDEAEAANKQAVKILERLAADFPAVSLLRKELAKTRTNLGMLFETRGRHAEAEATCRLAVKIQEKLAAEHPDMLEYRHGLAGIYNILGVALMGLGKSAEAEDAYRQALSILGKLCAEHPTRTESRIDLAGGQVNFGNLLRGNHQPESALQWYGEAITNLERVLVEVKGHGSALQYLRNAHLGRAQALDDLKRYPEASQDWDKAVKLAGEPERTYYRSMRAINWVRTGKWEAGLREAEELSKIRHPLTLYSAACAFALAAGREDESAVPLSREDCAKRAMGLLRQTVAAGLKDAEHMRKDDDLKALRERDDFKKLLADQEKESR